MKNILFRTNSSSLIGTGHIMRDLVFAKQFKDDNIIFAVQNLKGNINYKIKESGYKIELLEQNSIKELINIIKRYDISTIIIDSYDIDFKYEKKLKDKTNIKIVSFDDTYEKHHCDVLINHNIYANSKKYKNLVPNSCEIRCGSKYTLLRDEFYIQKKIKDNKSTNEKKSKKIKNIFLCMGGSDHSNISLKILKVLKKFDNIKVFLATTKSNQNIQKLNKYAKDNSFLNIFIDHTNIAKLIRRSDLCIVPPSVILNEVYFMNIPFIAIKTASNQKYMYKYLKKNDFCTLKSFDKKLFFNSLEKYLQI